VGRRVNWAPNYGSRALGGEALSGTQFVSLVTSGRSVLFLFFHNCSNNNNNTRCPVCFCFDEDGAHCFLKCKAMRQYWRELGLKFLIYELLQMSTAEEFVSEIMKMRSDICISVSVLL
jgi:hypothetical protein